MNDYSTSTASAELAAPQDEIPPQKSVAGKIARTIAEGFALMIFAQALSAMLTRAGATFLVQSQAQTQGVDKMMSGSPLAFAAIAVVLAPLMEEAIFRGLPSLVMRLTTQPETRARRVVWILFGLASSLLFAALHGVKNTSPTTIAFQTLPLPQLAVGLWAWHVATLRGLRYSMLLHATFNGIAVGLAFLAMALVGKI